MSSLTSYRAKRDFARSNEPSGNNASQGNGTNPIFVIQKHDASTLHYDLRLEVNGVLASWTVPKGPSTDPGEKRLAIRTEDHPLDYAQFEGVIPEGQYGAGTVMIWDRGTYENITETDGENHAVTEALKNGHVVAQLHGQKLSGGFALQRIDDENDNWLLIKLDDADADARRNPVSTQKRSVASNRSLDEIATQEKS